jgi:WD40 repeat protein
MKLYVLFATASLSLLPAQVGLFERSADVGRPGKVGRSSLQSGAYRITASGANIWAGRDDFHLLFKKVRGDVELSTATAWETTGGHEHKKAGLMLRATMDADSPHASVMVHADGLVSLQYRKEKGGPTQEVKAPVKGARRILLARYGDVVSMEVDSGSGFQPAGALSVALPEELLAGLAVCSHDDTNEQTARFSEVSMREWGVVADPKQRVLESTLEIVNVETGVRRVVHRARQHFEAPNWTPDGKTLVYNGGGKIWTIPVTGGTPTLLPTGDVRVNNDHGLTFDGRQLIISGSLPKSQSQIFVLPFPAGGPLRLLTPKAPSYWHGVSPDGRTIVYCASRDSEYDIYSMPMSGGEEKRLTTEKGLDDGPEYSPDGQWIYFNSVRSGTMRIWRMRPDGSAPEMVSKGPASADWFAHPSPDGKQIAYISYAPDVEGHPANKDVVLRVASEDGSNPKVMVTLFGGQGTMNVPSWSPDSREFAFVSYRLTPPAAGQ